MKIDGRCLCRSITFEAVVDPEKVSICHCMDCQSLGGSAFRMGVPAIDGTFRLLSGEPRHYLKTTADSGHQRVHAFCPDCGSGIYATDPGDGPKTYRLRFGAIKQRHQLSPKRQIWTRSAHSWINDIGSIESVETQ